MTIAVVGDGWWRWACKAAGEDHREWPPPVQPPANPYHADAKARMEIGPKWWELFEKDPVDVIVDNGATGLSFIPDPANTSRVKLLHEAVKVPLLSHWIDPMVTVFQALAPEATWGCLESDTWFKFVFDQPQAAELKAFGVPQAYHLPMAAPDREYNTAPLKEEDIRYPVSFVGGQNTSYFFPENAVPGDKLFYGTLAQSVRSDMPDVDFFSIYFELYGAAEPPRVDEPLSARMAKAQEYFQRKLFYNAMQCIRQRDRFVIFLKRKLGDLFMIFGDRWDTTYGLRCEPQIPSVDDYFEHFRRSAINVNFVNGNSDSGLNMRHFEITAAGGFLLCYHQPEIEEHFKVGEECDTFRSEHELLEKIQFYLEHSERRHEIALAGQRRTLCNHLYSHRLGEMLHTMNRALAPEPQEAASGNVPAKPTEALAQAAAS